jgi:hypothetical protein
MLWCHPFDVSVPVISRYNPEFFHDFGGGHAQVIIEIWEWQPWIWFVRCGWSRWPEEVEFLDGSWLYLRVSDDEQLVHVSRRRTTGGLARVAKWVKIGVIPEDLHDSMKDHFPGGLWGLVILSRDEDATVNCSRGGVKDVWGSVPGLIVVAKYLYGDAQELSAPFSFLVAVVCFVAGVEHRDGSHDVCSIYRHLLYLSKGILIWRGRCGLAMRGGVVRAVAEERHERERMSLRSRSLLLLTIWTFPPWA